MTSDINLEVLFRHMPLEYAVIGEGEQTLPELLNFLNLRKGCIDRINGIVYRVTDGKPIATAPLDPSKF